MTNQTKVLLIFTGIMAFVIGAAFNSARLAPLKEVSELLNAKLLQRDGSEITVKDQTGEITLINFWASWCAPCRREMPLFEAIYQQNRANGFKIVGIAIDSPDKAESMLDSMGITYPNLYAEKTGMDLMELSGNELGAMPYSLLIGADGQVIDRKLGEIHEPQLQTWAKGLEYKRQ